MAPSDSLVQRFLWENRKNGIFEVLGTYHFLAHGGGGAGGNGGDQVNIID